MKFNRLRPMLAMMLAVVMTSMLITPTFAAAKYYGGGKKDKSPKKLAVIRKDVLKSVKNGDNRDQFSNDDLEQMRSALVDLVNANQLISTLLPSDKGEKGGFQIKAGDFDRARTQIQQMSGKDLTTFRSGLDPSRMREKLANSQTILTEYKDGLANHSPGAPDSSGLPGITSYCGTPIDSGVIIAADVVYFLAEAVRDIAQDGCNQVLVVLGEGGNGRAVCLVTDAVYIIAEAVYQALHFCDDDYAASVGEANFARLGHIHGDLEDSVTNDNTNKTTIVNNDNTNKDTIVNNDNANTLTLDAHATANKTTIVNNDNANTLALTNLVDAALTQIVNNANANKDEMKNLLLRTQIEADLASTDGSAFVVLFETPSTVCFPSLNAFGLPQVGVPASVTQCGLLDLVRSIVSQSIANMGTGTNAQSYFVAADAQKALGRYKSAYALYRQAFKAAGK